MKPIYDREYKPRPTMTVGELIEKLKEYPEDTRIAAEWEDLYAAITPDAFSYSVGDTESPWPMLIINVNNY